MKRFVSFVLLAACSSSDPDVVEDVDGSVVPPPVDAAPEPIDAAPEPDAPPVVHGLRASYFKKHGAKVLSRIDPTVDFTWERGAPADEVGIDHFSVRWTGTLEVPTAGLYTFHVRADDGTRLWIGDEQLVDDWRFHAAEDHEGTIDLPAGPVAVRLEYFDKDFDASAHLYWRGPGLDEEVVPEAALLPAASDDAPAPEPPYDNPVIAKDCPDPGVMADGGAYYMVCTGGHFYIKKSDDLVLWEETGAMVLPDGKPAWAANGGRNWAPELHRVGDKIVAYYTSVNAANKLCIGAAWADSPLGPYTDSGAPLVEDAVGVIDASYFQDDNGKHYLTYKIDGNQNGNPTPIFIRELRPDGLGFAPGSTAKQLLVNDGGTWEGGVVEGQWLVKRNGMYYLFYSGNVYDHRYRTGVARASNLFGPYQKKGDPILANNMRWVGPGHGSVIPVGDKDYFAYHAWNALPDGKHDGSKGRWTLLDPIDWDNGWPKIGNGSPSTGLLAWP